MFDTKHVQNVVSTGVLNLMKEFLSVIALVSLMFYQNWKLTALKFNVLQSVLINHWVKELEKQ